MTHPLSPKTRAVHHQYFIRAPRDKVFQWITHPNRLVTWLADHAEVEARKGGRYTLSWKDGPTHVGTLLDFAPGKSITLSWEWEGVALRGTEFKLSVVTKGQGTLLTVDHSGFPDASDWVDLLAGAEWGWTYFAMNLKSVLETGHDLRSKHDG